MIKNKKNLYIDKEEFHDALVQYKNKTGGKKIENYVGKCVLDICNNLAKKGCWSGYTYVDEMKEDGIENCIKAIRSYDVNNEKKNPFWYFSFIAERAFIRRMYAEKRQTYLKHMNVREYFLHGKLDGIESSDLSDKVIEEFEAKKAEIKAKKAEKMREKKALEKDNEKN
jgi:hypothetical protein